MIEGLFKRFTNILAHVYLGGAPRVEQKPLPEILFYPVIFANGRDDDSEGLKAFFENRPYVLRGRLFQPTTSARVLHGLHLTISRNSIVFIKNGRVDFIFGNPSGSALTVSVSHGLSRKTDYCSFTLGAKVSA